MSFSSFVLLNVDSAAPDMITGEQFVHHPGWSAVIEPSYLAESEADLKGGELITGQRLLVQRTETWTRPRQLGAQPRPVKTASTFPLTLPISLQLIRKSVNLTYMYASRMRTMLRSDVDAM